MKSSKAIKKKKLDEIEEVYEEINGFFEHTKKAFKSFLYIVYLTLKFILGGLLYKIIFPVLEKILWLLFLVFIFLCAIIALASNKVLKCIKKNRNLNPFLNQRNS